MTERSAQPAASPAEQTRKARRQAAKTAQPGSAPSSPAPAGDTAERTGFAERLQAKLAATPEPSSETVKRPGRAPRRARLRLTRIDPWSVMKTSFLLSIAFGVVTVVAVAMVWQVLGAAGVWDSINSTIRESLEGDASDFTIQDYLGTSRVLGFTMLVAAVDVVLITAISTLGAFLYNMAAALLGGVEVTLAED